MKFGLLLLALAFSANSIAKSNMAPNIIYILADDMGPGDTQAFNQNSKIATPNLLKLANEGMRFTNIHTNSSVCTPTRYGILTGRYAWRTSLKKSVLNAQSPHLIDPDRETVASLLKKQGYATAVVGKWHLGVDWPTVNNKALMNHGYNVDFNRPIQFGPRSNGFDYFYGIVASLNMNPHLYVKNELADVAPEDLIFLRNQEDIYASGMISIPRGSTKPGWKDKHFKQDQVQNVLVSKSIEWIEQQHNKNQPFFLYLPLNSPHYPIVPSKAFKGRSKLSIHGDFVMEMDHEIGRLMAKLDELELTDDTLVIFTSDNGTSSKANLADMQKQGHYSSLHYRGLKGSLYEGGHRVPFIARWPGVVKAGRTSDYHGSVVDLLATLADMTGVKLADNAGEDSVSMLPILLGDEDTSAERPVIYHSDKGFFAIRQGEYKLILHPNAGSNRNNPKDKNNPIQNPGPVQLFNMIEDPSESNNLQAAKPEIVTALVQSLESIIQTGRSTPGAEQKNDKVDAKTLNEWIKQQQGYLNPEVFK
jgi:arylsulfatase A-like enzyme